MIVSLVYALAMVKAVAEFAGHARRAQGSSTEDAEFSARNSASAGERYTKSPSYDTVEPTNGTRPAFTSKQLDLPSASNEKHSGFSLAQPPSKIEIQGHHYLVLTEPVNTDHGIPSGTAVATSATAEKTTGRFQYSVHSRFTYQEFTLQRQRSCRSSVYGTEQQHPAFTATTVRFPLTTDHKAPLLLEWKPEETDQSSSLQDATCADSQIEQQESASASRLDYLVHISDVQAVHRHDQTRLWSQMAVSAYLHAPDFLSEPTVVANELPALLTTSIEREPHAEDETLSRASPAPTYLVSLNGLSKCPRLCTDQCRLFSQLLASVLCYPSDLPCDPVEQTCDLSSTEMPPYCTDLIKYQPPLDFSSIGLCADDSPLYTIVFVLSPMRVYDIQVAPYWNMCGDDGFHSIASRIYRPTFGGDGANSSAKLVGRPIGKRVAHPVIGISNVLYFVAAMKDVVIPLTWGSILLCVYEGVSLVMQTDDGSSDVAVLAHSLQQLGYHLSYIVIAISLAASPAKRRQRTSVQRLTLAALISLCASHRVVRIAGLIEYKAPLLICAAPAEASSLSVVSSAPLAALVRQDPQTSRSSRGLQTSVKVAVLLVLLGVSRNMDATDLMRNATLSFGTVDGVLNLPVWSSSLRIRYVFVQQEAKKIGCESAPRFEELPAATDDVSAMDWSLLDGDSATYDTNMDVCPAVSSEYKTWTDTTFGDSAMIDADLESWSTFEDESWSTVEYESFGDAVMTDAPYYDDGVCENAKGVEFASCSWSVV
ncbi:hypothetical protein BZA70DRAFT_278343 [Myxozyma melibiosi]|uniref:FZ domain-containing protein n=1 Tax=Myxozyma melibiosi TaxID=54550 RepID=A0ABR1F6R7_9ASCO